MCDEAVMALDKEIGKISEAQSESAKNKAPGNEMPNAQAKLGVQEPNQQRPFESNKMVQDGQAKA